MADLMRRAGAPPAGKSMRAAQRFADDLLLREAKRNLAERGPGLLDAEITQAEAASDPALLDLTALRNGEIGKLSAAQDAFVS